jgi:uroporphyrinogen decarboxylase
MGNFEPNFNNILDAANNIAAKRIPLYEHNISICRMELILKKSFAQLEEGDEQENTNSLKIIVSFLKQWVMTRLVTSNV